MKGDIYSLINLMGLSIGISACLMIFIYIADELRYDRHNHEPENIYRVLLETPARESVGAILPAVMYNSLENRLSGVEKIGRLQILSNDLVFKEEAGEPMIENQLAFADPTILDIFSFEFIKGNPSTALSTPYSLILTESAAEKYFGNKNSVDKTLLLENALPFVVSAVIKDLPEQSHFQFSVLGNLQAMSSLSPAVLTNWHNLSQIFYIRLFPGADPLNVAEQITQIVWDANETYNERTYFHLQPLTDIRLKSGHVEWEVAKTGNIMVVRVFSLIALLILALACFNFINLSLAMSVKRAREIGIRKAMGAGRPELIKQFIAETFFLGLIALILALLVVEIFLPALNNLTGKNLSAEIFTSPNVLTFAAILLILISLIAGGYPAVVISRFKPITALKGMKMSSNQGSSGKTVQFRLRQLLMVLQFSVSTALIVVSLMILLQMRYMTGRHPGYVKENLISIKNPMDDHMETRALWLKNQLLQHKDITDVSFAHNLPPVKPHIYSNFGFESEDGASQIHGVLISVDSDFFTAMQSRIILGRDFSSEMSTDEPNAAIINSTMLAQMNVDDPTGISLNGFHDHTPRRIIGVVEDIYYNSLHEPVGPMVFYIGADRYPQNFFNILVRYKEGTTASTLTTLENLWNEEAANWPLQYQFIDMQVNEFYQEDRQTMLIVISFSAIAILLSIMGLIGLALYTASARTKEIGIRKVLGAGIKEIILMINKEFGILVIISNLIAWPAAWYFIHRWLENFAYHIHIQLFAFVIPTLFVFFIAILVVSVISLRAANQNPVNTIMTTE